MLKGKLFAWALLLSLGTLLAARAQSHTGDDTSQGCHTDPRTGTYHCHTPKTPPKDVVTLTFCYVVRDQQRCGYERNACYELVARYGGSCQPQLGLRFE
jgi:hypothetical protein